MQNFSDATYKNILDYMLSLVPDTYDKRDTSPIQTSLGPAAYRRSSRQLPAIRWIFWQCWPVSPASRLPPL